MRDKISKLEKLRTLKTASWMDEEINDEDCDYENNLIIISYYPYPANIKYCLEIDADFDNLGKISFHHRGDIITSRNFSKFEIKNILTLIKNIRLPIFFQDHEENMLTVIDPNITSKLTIRSEKLEASFTWDSEDRENFAEQLSNIDEFVEMIESLIDVDFTKLEMPIYL